MQKLVFMFPGVGSQYVGMGKTFYDRFEVFRQTMDEGSERLGLDLPGLCFEKKNATELSKLENAQLALVTLSVGIFKVYMQEIGIPPNFCMGHSLGEYSALSCAGVMEFADALELVKKRGEIINHVSASVSGTMMWVINLDQEKVAHICREVSQPGAEVYISAYDSPTQTSISGHNDSIMTAAKKLETEGAIVYPLKMSGPFHSPLMEQAAQEMKAILEQYSYKDPLYPVLANRNAQPYENKESVVQHLSQQLISPIRWQDSIAYIEKQGTTIAIEIGPKDVLKFLMKKNSSAVQPYTMDNEKDLQTLRDTFLVDETEYLQVVGRCLGVAVSTKNRNDDNESYERDVIQPYRRIEHLYETFKAEGKTPSKEQVEEALHTLHSLLQAKKVPSLEQERGFGKVLGGRVLRGSPLWWPGASASSGSATISPG
jgi:[acyl-carrier-protein] S-malonyltransferase